MNKNWKAFTLAEVLITLGIIGIVAAMTIPTLIFNYQTREMQVRLKKTYSVLNQMSRLFLEENEEPIPLYVSRNGHHSIKNILLTYIKGMTVVDSNIWSTAEEDKTTSIKYYSFNGAYIYQFCDLSGWLTDINGVYYAYNDMPTYGENGPLICIDLNGAAKPNVVGIDYFIFIPTTDGAVIPMGMEHEDNTTEEYRGGNFFTPATGYCGRSSICSACAYYAVKDIAPPSGSGTYWKDYIGKKQYKK